VEFADELFVEVFFEAMAGLLKGVRARPSFGDWLLRTGKFLKEAATTELLYLVAGQDSVTSSRTGDFALSLHSLVGTETRDALEEAILEGLVLKSKLTWAETS
jgi:hypothetical protein